MSDRLAATHNRSSWWQGSLLALVSGLGVFALMANQGRLPHGALLGLLPMLGVVVGIWGVLGLWQRADPSMEPLIKLGAKPGEPAFCAPGLTVPVALALTVAAVAVPDWLRATLLWIALAVLGVSALRRPGLLVFAVVSALYLPMLGGFGLWDPWETHYGEVVREILARDDWISLWWAQDRWFWSKPILIFWSEALSWSASGVDFRPDSNPANTEWAIRMPIFCMAMTALLIVYATISRFFGKAGGVLAALVLATTPYYGFLAHQAITDMPMVASVTSAVMLLLLAVHEDPERSLRSYRLGPMAVSGQHLVIGAFVMLLVPQALYLMSRNVTLVNGLFALHPDSFLFGSADNGGVPGNQKLRTNLPAFRQLWLQPMAQALFWLGAMALVLWRMARERSAQGIFMFGFYIACALAFMGKGLPGIALPGLVALLYLLAFNRWHLLLEGRLKVAIGATALISVGMPWFVSMFLRHGAPFTDRLLIHDHINRLTKGVHGDNGTIQYFVWQLGYGLFPWVALAPAALAGWLWIGRADSDDPEEQTRRQVLQLLGLWFAATFTLFSAMTTKFHHYIFPAGPPAAILMGLLLARMLGKTATPSDTIGRVRLLAGICAPVPFVLGLAGLRGDVRGVLPAGLSMGERAVWVFQHSWHPALCGGLLLAGAGMCFMAWYGQRPASSKASLGGSMAALLLCGAGVLALVGRDLAWSTSETPIGSERLIQLFIYNYKRPFPEHLDYRPMFTAFAAVGTLWTVAAAWRRTRAVAASGLLGLALLVSAWSLNVYMVDLTPHWGQRELVKQYYKLRKGPDEPLVAWQMNWKGENYYTGNRVAVFVDLDNKKVKKWVDKNKGKRAFFVLEHKRLKRLRTMLGKRHVVELSTERQNNKFLLVKVML